MWIKCYLSSAVWAVCVVHVRVMIFHLVFWWRRSELSLVVNDTVGEKMCCTLNRILMGAVAKVQKMVRASLWKGVCEVLRLYVTQSVTPRLLER